jgi:hypothetical protein
MLTRTGVLCLAVAFLATAGAGGLTLYDWLHRDTGRQPPKTAVVVTAPPSRPPSATPTPTPSPTPVPDSLRQAVPFTIQAPFQNWDSAHDEYCEAAAVYMVGQFFQGDARATIPPAEADAAMGGIVSWERSTFPGTVNLSLDQMTQVGAHFYGLKGQVVPVDFQGIERTLASGLPVIIPVMTHGGPGGSRIYPTYGRENVYHVLVLVGYDNARGPIVYTNDAGLREGAGLGYAWGTLAAAVDAQAHTQSDQAGAAVPMQQGASMLIFNR